MTKVLFCHGAPDRLQGAAAWLALNAAPGQSQSATVVYAPDREVADHLDRLLWTHPATGFLPHCRTDSKLAGETPILIAASLDALPQHQCLLNLSNELPPAFSRFDDLVEIVSVEDAVRLPARDRVKFYRDRGYDIRFRDLQKEPL